MALKPSAHNQHNLRIVHGACPHDCPDTCALETLVDEHGRAVSVYSILKEILLMSCLVPIGFAESSQGRSHL